MHQAPGSGARLDFETETGGADGDVSMREKTARDAILYLYSAGKPEAIEVFLYLANHSHELRTGDGQRLNDATDFKVFFVELAEAMREITVRVQ